MRGILPILSLGIASSTATPLDELTRLVSDGLLKRALLPNNIFLQEDRGLLSPEFIFPARRIIETLRILQLQAGVDSEAALSSDSAPSVDDWILFRTALAMALNNAATAVVPPVVELEISPTSCTSH